MASKLELHYFFEDNSHRIDANYRSKCEVEILRLFKELSNELLLPIELEKEVSKEGGFIDIWNIIETKHLQVATLLTTIVAIILSRFPVRTSNKKLESIQLEIAKLQFEKLKSEAIEKIKKDQTKLEKIEMSTLEVKMPPSPRVNLDLLTKRLDNILFYIEHSPKIKKIRSNFYFYLYEYKKISKISTTPLHENYKEIQTPSIVLREQFQQFIMESDNLPNETIENALIEIVSPVLRKGKHKWKGIFKDNSIEFSMQDKAFKDLIYNKKVSFVMGISITCILEIKRTMNDIGNENITAYSVLTVLNYNDGKEKIETERGKDNRRKKEFIRDQTTLDLENSES